MKDKPNEWVTVSDLMAGALAVMMLLLVVSVIQQSYLELKHQQEIEQGEAAQKQIVSNLFKNMKETYEKMNLSNLISFEPEQFKITFKDGLFERGSAKITPEFQQAFIETQQQIMKFLSEIPNSKIYVEGHTDNIPVLKPVTDLQRFGAVYDDNYTLSAARAREARKVIIGNLSEADANRIIVAGYGSSKPLHPENPEAASNRRIEIRLTLDEDSHKEKANDNH